MCSDAVRYIMHTQYHTILINYIDDLIYTGLSSNINATFDDLLFILRQLGLDVSQKKFVKPSTLAICLGILINAISRTTSIPPDKLNQINQFCMDWKSKVTCAKDLFVFLLFN